MVSPTKKRMIPDKMRKILIVLMVLIFFPHHIPVIVKRKAIIKNKAGYNNEICQKRFNPKVASITLNPTAILAKTKYLVLCASNEKIKAFDFPPFVTVVKPAANTSKAPIYLISHLPNKLPIPIPAKEKRPKIKAVIKENLITSFVETVFSIPTINPIAKEINKSAI